LEVRKLIAQARQWAERLGVRSQHIVDMARVKADR
jgi:hypothetical protein